MDKQTTRSNGKHSQGMEKNSYLKIMNRRQGDRKQMNSVVIIVILTVVVSIATSVILTFVVLNMFK